MDALLGALALGDIGLHFPDTSAQWKGADSIAMLGHVVHIIQHQGAHVVNVDATVVLEALRLRPHIEAMREKLAEAIGIDIKRVSVKATTSEKLGFVGREEGVAAFAVAQVEY